MDSASPAITATSLSLGGGVLTDSQGVEWQVTLVIPAKSHCCEVYCTFTPRASEVPDDAGDALWDDSEVLEGLNELLRGFGYKGPVVGRAESGMQGHRLVVLDTSRSFEAFAIQVVGWMPEDGLELWTRSCIRADFRDSMVASAKELVLKESASVRWHVPLHAVLSAVEHVVSESPDSSLFERVYQAPENRGNLEWLASFLQEHADVAWGALAPYAQRRTSDTAVHPALQALRSGEANVPTAARAA